MIALLLGSTQRLLLLAFLLAALAVPAAALDAPVVCQAGRGSFQAQPIHQMEISVAAERASGGFARRACQATIRQPHQQTVLATAWQIDADLIDGDLGLHEPVAAFQVRLTEADPLASYILYGISARPRLLRTLTSGSVYAAADKDLDGRVEIWTNDARSLLNLDGLPASAFDDLPPVVLRFEKQKLVDVTAEFQPEIDRRIATLKAALDPAQVAAFQQTNGQLDHLPPLQFVHLRELYQTKIRILELAAHYLTSHREALAQQTLDELWPATDRVRIKALLAGRRATSWPREVDAVSTGARGKPGHASLYQENAPPAGQNPAAWRTADHLYSTADSALRSNEIQVDENAIPIQLSRPVDLEHPQLQDQASARLRLLIDSAGKVRSATVLGDPDPGIEAASVGWKFIPARKAGHPVAVWQIVNVNPKQ